MFDKRLKTHIYLNQLKVETLQPHPVVANFNYPFGIMVFSHKQLSSDSYATLVNSIMPTILNKFITLFQHTTDSLQLLVGNQQNMTGNTTQYQPPYQTSFAPDTSIPNLPSTSYHVHQQHQPATAVQQQHQQQATASTMPPPTAGGSGLSYNQATGNFTILILFLQ